MRSLSPHQDLGAGRDGQQLLRLADQCDLDAEGGAVLCLVQGFPRSSLCLRYHLPLFYKLRRGAEALYVSGNEAVS